MAVSGRHASGLTMITFYLENLPENKVRISG